MTTALIAKYFRAGLSVQELAVKAGMPIKKVEAALRRFMEERG